MAHTTKQPGKVPRNGKNDDATNVVTTTIAANGSDGHPATNRQLNDGRTRRYYDGR